METNTVEIIGDIIPGEAAKARRKLEQLIKSVNRSAFDVAELLFVVKSKGYFEEATFSEYTKSLEIKPRKASYLVHMIEVMSFLEIPREQYEPLGISKLRIITSLDPEGSWTNPQDPTSIVPLKEFIIGFIEKGKEMSLEEIQKHVRTLKGIVGEQDIVWKNLPFTRNVIDTVYDAAVELTRKNLGSVSKDSEGISQDAKEARCVEVWAVEYLNDPWNHQEE